LRSLGAGGAFLILEGGEKTEGGSRTLGGKKKTVFAKKKRKSLKLKTRHGSRNTEGRMGKRYLWEKEKRGLVRRSREKRRKKKKGPISLVGKKERKKTGEGGPSWGGGSSGERRPRSGENGRGSIEKEKHTTSRKYRIFRKTAPEKSLVGRGAKAKRKPLGILPEGKKRAPKKNLPPFPERGGGEWFLSFPPSNKKTNSPPK